MDPSYYPSFQPPYGAGYPPLMSTLPPSNAPVSSTLALAVQTPAARPTDAQRVIARRPARRGGQWQAALPTPPPSVSPQETHSVAAPHYAAPVGRVHAPSVGRDYAPSVVSSSAPGVGLGARHRTSGPRAGPSSSHSIQHPASTTGGPPPRGYLATQFGPYAGVVPHASNGSQPIPQISLGHAVPAGMQEAADSGRPMKRKNTTDDEGDIDDEDEEDEEEEEDEAALRARRLKAKQKARLLAVGEDGYRISPQTPEDGKIKHKTYAEEITKDLTTAVYCCSHGGDLRHRKTDKHRLAWGEAKGIFVPLIRMYRCHADGCKKWLKRSDRLVCHHKTCDIYKRQMQAETQAEANTESNPAVVAGDLAPSGSPTLPSPTLPVMITPDVARQGPIDEPSSTPETIIQQQLQEPPAGSLPTSTLAPNFLDMPTFKFTTEEADFFAQLFSMTDGAASSSSSATAPSATAPSNVIEEQPYDGFSFSSASVSGHGGLQGELLADFDPVTSFPPDIPDEHTWPQDPWSFFDHAFD